VYTLNDWFSTNLILGGSSYAVNSVDPNSDNIINNLVAANGGSLLLNINGFSSAVSKHSVPVNHDVTSNLTFYPTSGFTMQNDQYGDDNAQQAPWESTFLTQGGCSTGECHIDVLATDTCVDYETYASSPKNSYPIDNQGNYEAISGFVHNLNHPFNDQYASYIPAVTVGGIPLLGTDDIGEDASLPVINHIAYMVMPGSDGSPVATGGHIAPAVGGAKCSSHCSFELPVGARLRLNPAKYTCPNPVTNPQANHICVQLENYGMIFADRGAPSGWYEVIVGPTASGGDAWNPTDLNAISTTGNAGIPLQDFDVMTLGPITNP
jgi:hypothetical protein